MRHPRIRWTVPMALLIAGVFAPAGAADPNESCPRDLRGRVVTWPEDRPVSGARVAAFDPVGPSGWDDQWPWPGASELPLVATTTDSNGAFVLTLPDAVRPRKLRVQAEAPGRGTVCFQVAARGNPESAAAIVFPLPPGVQTRVRVTDAGGAAVQDARVMCLPQRRVAGTEERYCDGRLAIHPAGHTGVDGTLDGIGLLPGCYLMRAFSGGRGGGQVAITVTGGETIDLRLDPPREAAGRVTLESTGAPMGGVAVMARGPFGVPVAATRTDTDGTYRLVDLPADDLTLMGYLDGYYQARPHESDPAHLGGEMALADCRDPGKQSPRTSSIHGQVRLEDDDLPIPGAAVQAAGVRTTSDADGRFRLEGLPAGLVEVWVGETIRHEPEVTQVELQAGEIAQDRVLTCRFWPCRLFGRVRDQAGRAVVGAQVFAQFGLSSNGQDFDAGHYFPRSIETDLEGTFDVIEPTEDPHVVLFAVHPILGRVQTPPLAVRDLARQPPIDLRLQGTSLTGRLLDARGAPVAGAHVRWQEVVAYGYESRWSEKLSGSDPEATTDHAGRFHLSGAPSGPAALRVSRNLRDEGILRWLWLDPGTHPEELELKLSAERAVRGRVCDALGFGQPAWQVIGESATGAAWQDAVWTNLDGTFEFTGVPATTWAVHLRLMLPNRSIGVRRVPADSRVTLPLAGSRW